jgi:microcystin-dependent protein
MRTKLIALVLTIFPLPSLACSLEPFIGEVCTFAFNFCPRGWAETNGQLLPINQNQALFSLLGTQYGGDGRVTFALPDLRSRTVVGTGQAPGLSAVLIGEQGGQENVTLTTLNLPRHKHYAKTVVSSALKGASAIANSNGPQGAVLARQQSGKLYYTGTADVIMGSSSIVSTAATNIGKTGGNQPFDNRQPYLGMTTCIALQGIFPSRN